MENESAFDFDCPQYYDFEKGADDSHPEMYFDTKHALSPLTVQMTPLSEVGSNSRREPSTDGQRVSDMKFVVNDAPYQNTRLSRRKTTLSKDKRKSQMPQASLIKLQTVDEPQLKKSRVPETTKPFKKPGTALKTKRTMFSFNNLNQENKDPAPKKRKLNSSGTTSHTTIPAPFSFQTDKRLKLDSNISVAEYKPVDFVATLRSNRTVQNARVAKGPVRPVPERLLRKRKIDSCKTMAEQVLSFQQELSNRVKPSTPAGAKGQRRSPQVTHPVTPHFRVAGRSRPVNVISQEQKEEMEAEEMKKYHFKAQPMNPKILVPFGIKISKPVEKSAPIPMHLQTEKRAIRKPRAKSLERPPEFHARPVPTRILQGVTGLGEKVMSKPTEAHSPTFALKKREGNWKQLQEEARLKEEAAAMAATEDAALKARRSIRPRSRSQDVSVALRNTIAAPFSFFARDQSTLAKKGEKIQHLLDEEKKLREFRANPMPSPVVSGLPERKKKSATKVQGFSLELDQRARDKAFKWQREMEEVLKQQQDALVFKAKPCTVTKSEPFKPAKSAKHTTEFAEFPLHSNSRAALRDRFDEELKQKEEQRQAELMIREQARKEEEEKEIAELRAKAVHKANPVPHHQAFEVKHNLIPVTKPVSPKFETDRRLRRKSK